MTATSNTPLKVPFNEKDQAKALGARWNPDGKHWYIPQGVETAPFEKWLAGAPAPNASPPQTTSKPLAKTDNSNNPKPKADDMDAINAMLRDAYEENDYLD